MGEAKATRKAEKEAKRARSDPSERSSKPKKKRKLPGQPKKPMTAYFQWLNAEGRDDIKKEHPGMTITEAAKAAGEKWKNLDEEVKKKYLDRHKEMKERYEEEYRVWFKDGGKELIKAAKKKWNKGRSSKDFKRRAFNKDQESTLRVTSKEFIEDSGDSEDTI